jgi:pimeloyl-ACP methyl ester carboxylesterase
VAIFILLMDLFIHIYKMMIMKKVLYTLFLLFLIPMFGSAQAIVGSWQGKLNIQGQELPLIFHVDQKDGRWTGRMDSPKQGAKGIPLDEVKWTGDLLQLYLKTGGIQYEGRIQSDKSIKGVFKQGSFESPLDLQFDKDAAIQARRPQTPQAPFPYTATEVMIPTPTEGVQLGATLTMPAGEGPFPAVVLISGSGPQDRNQTIFEHQPFWVLADYLTRQGIAVLRYDDRGVGQSTGPFQTATSKDFAIDAEAAFAYLQQQKGVDPKRVGLLGHSEGGMIAPMVAVANKSVSFTVLMAPPVIPISQLMVLQNKVLGQQMGLNDNQLAINEKINAGAYQIVQQYEEPDQLEAQLKLFFTSVVQSQGVPSDQIETVIRPQVQSLMNPWFRYFIKYDPKINLLQLEVPTLFLFGKLDRQVTYEENSLAANQIAKQNEKMKATIVDFAQLNHLFQESTTGSPEEYAQIEQTISPRVLSAILSFIQQQ